MDNNNENSNYKQCN